MPLFKKRHVLVVGDTMLDSFYHGVSSRLTPDAPVPVVRVRSQQQWLGGAANVARDVSCLRMDATLFGFKGEDAAGQSVTELLQRYQVKDRQVRSHGCTTTKMNILSESPGGERQKLLRLDFEETPQATSDQMNELIESLNRHLPSADSVIISDYAKGVCSNDVCRNIIHECSARGIPVLVDPKGVNWEKYHGATLIKPNLSELSTFLDRKVGNVETEIEVACREALQRSGAKYLLVTRDRDGLSLVSESYSMHISSVAEVVSDVVGAGDAVIASLACALASGYDPVDAMRIANAAGGLRVERTRSYELTQEDIAGRVLGHETAKTLKGTRIDTICRELQASGKKIVFTNGCFDILHNGHIIHLSQAKALGDVLIVGINDDDSVRRTKGPGRPVMPLKDRIAILSSLVFVDFIVVFSEDTPESILETIRPTVLVKGGNLAPEEVIGRQFATKTILLPVIGEYSTSKIVRNLKDKEGQTSDSKPT